MVKPGLFVYVLAALVVIIVVAGFAVFVMFGRSPDYYRMILIVISHLFSGIVLGLIYYKYYKRSAVL